MPRSRVFKARVTCTCLAAFAAVALAVALAGCGSEDEHRDERVLRIYASQAMRAGRGGLDAVRAIRSAVEEADAAIAGARVEVVGLNDAGPSGAYSPRLVRRNAAMAARDDSSIAYVGDYDSGATEISMPILNRAGMLQVSGTSTAVLLTRGGDRIARRLQPTGTRTFARVVPNDLVQVAALELFMEEESVRRLFVVSDGSDYGDGLAEGVARLAPGSGIEIVGRARLRRGSDPPAIGRRSARAGADSLLIAGSDFGKALGVFTAAHRADVRIKLFGGDGLSLPGFLRSLGDLELDTYLTAPTLPPGNYAQSGERFLSDFREHYGRAPAPLSVFAYEAGSAIMASLARGTRGDIRDASIADLRSGVRDAFFSITERASALGSYSIDDYGDTTLSSYGAYRVEDGRLVLGRALNIPPSLLAEAAG